MATRGRAVMLTGRSAQGRVLVTGGAGFVGSRVVGQLIDREYDVYVLARDKHKLTDRLAGRGSNRLTLLSGDLLKDADLARLESDLATRVKDLDFIVHLVGGGPLTSNEAFAKQITDLNYTATANLLDILKSAGKLNSVSLMVYLSSLAAMGIPSSDGHRIVYRETTPCNPVLAYERAKLKTEHFLEELALTRHLKTFILRVPQIYGSPSDPLIGIINLMRRRLFPVVRKRVGSLPLIHVGDVAEAVCTVLENHNRIRVPCEIDVLCEKSYSYTELADIVRHKYGQAGLLQVPFWFLYAATAITELVCSVLNRPEPLNRRRLVSMTMDRIVDSSKFVDSFHFNFHHNVQSFLTKELN
ncbi:MAG: NAD(P)-dependent oxidoreductase [Acidobacteria bacterium]|nr:NAD(P)-dependent oxidoreductase [Acidobacteriota bacterium]